MILNLNIGTTMKGAIDNFHKVLDILKSCEIKEYYIHCDAAAFGGYLPFLNGSPEINFVYPMNSVSVSLHKFIGLPFPAAIFLVRNELLNFLPDNVINSSYTGSYLNTLSCSRNGHSAIFTYSRLLQLGGDDGIKNKAQYCVSLAQYAEKCLKNIQYPFVLRNDFSNIVVFSTPNKEIITKWQLAVNTKYAHIIVMPNVTKDIIDSFVEDMYNYNLGLKDRQTQGELKDAQLTEVAM